MLSLGNSLQFKELTGAHVFCKALFYISKLALFPLKACLNEGTFSQECAYIAVITVFLS